ncbi:MAG: hypothetical protein JSV89_17115 [Spirochaetaceae bacterium]|nr:MAG: hypothetical protein JSV89_17115 [Spirochaetaceae bacterium]
MKVKLMRWIFIAICLSGAAASVTAQESFYEETFSIYGYVVNFFSANVYTDDWGIIDSDYGNILYGRLKGDWNPGENLSFHAELAYNAAIGNQNPYVVYESYGLLPVDLADENVTFNEDLVQTISVDHLWGSVNLGRFDLQFGKLPIAWGTGYFFNPTSKAAVTAYLDTVSEETPGTVGIVPSVSFLEGFLSVQGYAAFQDKSHSTLPVAVDGNWANLPFGLKLQGIIGAFDLSGSWIKEVILTPDGWSRVHYLGTDFAGAVWNFGVYGEAALKMWDESEVNIALKNERISELLDFCVGFDYFIPGLEIDTRMEYYHQGPGTREKGEYDADFSKLLSGEQLVLAEDYLLLYLERSFLDYLSITTVGLININDGSLGFVPELSGEPYGNFQVGLGAMLFFGPAGSEFDGEYTGSFDLTEPAVYMRCKLSF